MSDENMDAAVEAFKERDDFLITVHVNPEGDSVGSQLAVYHMLRKLGKRAVMVNHDEVPDNLTFLPGNDLIMRETPPDFNVDTVVVLDCPVKERTGRIKGILDKAKFIVNIDHHVSNEYFGDVNWVEPEASSVGEMLFFAARKLGLEIDHDLAAAIYTAIVTDTGMFNYNNTSRRTHEVAGELIEEGVNPKAMHSEIFEKKKLSEIRMLGRVLATLQIEEDGAVAHMSLTDKMYKAEGIDFVSTEQFINYPRSIAGVEVAIFFRESHDGSGKINVSFRSGEKVDVDTLAARFGGGGHKRASGCLVEGRLPEVMDKVLAEVSKALKKAGKGK